MKKLAFFAILLMLFNGCTIIIREIKYFHADIDDAKVFPKYDLEKSDNPFTFQLKEESFIDTLAARSKDSVVQNFKNIIANTSTRAFLVIRNDSILFEKYYRGYKKEDVSTFFSVSKSITSLMIGIAIDDGYIKSIDDPVTKYIPELGNADPKFKKLTIKNLLDMRSGIKFNESYSSPLAWMARLYYGTNQLGKIKRMKFEYEPGEKHIYQSVSTAILGQVIEKTTGMTMAKYFDQKVWKPLKMENNACWSLDDKKHRSTKAYCGLNSTARDLAKIGRLYNNNGAFEGKQIVSKEWVKKTLTPNIANDGYQYLWYSFSGYGSDTAGNRTFPDSLSAVERQKVRYQKYPHYNIWQNTDETWGLSLYTNQFYALGIMHQILFIDPEKNIIIVRLGDNNDSNYLGLMYKLTKIL